MRRDRAATLVQTALLNVNGDPYVELPVKDALFSGRLKIALDRSLELSFRNLGNLDSLMGRRALFVQGRKVCTCLDMFELVLFLVCLDLYIEF